MSVVGRRQHTEPGFSLERTLHEGDMLPFKDMTILVVAFTLAIVVFHVICYVMEKIRILAVHVMSWEPVRPRLGIQETQDAEQARRRNRRLKQPEENDEPPD